MADGIQAWVVRAGRDGEAEASNLALGRATIAWSDVPDLSSLTSRDQVRLLVDRLYPDGSAQSHANSAGQLWAFRSSIAEGDLVIMPLKTQRGLLAIGRVVGSYGYDPAAPEHARHFIPVQWNLDRVERSALRSDLEAMVNGAMTVFSVTRNDAVARLLRVAEGGVDPGWGSSDDGTEPVRRWLLDHALLQVLDETGPLLRSAALERVAERLDGQLTPYELATIKEGDETPRWATTLTWSTTDLAAAGWIIKSREGWQITDSGREALLSHPGGVGLDADASKAYRDRKKQGKAGQGSRYLAILEASLELLEAGQWTTYGELASVAGTNAQTVGNVMRQAGIEGAHRVLSANGRPSPSFSWLDGRTDDLRDVLESEGLRFESDGTASEAQHLRTEDFRAFLEDKGVLAGAAKRAWLVRGSSVDGHDLVPQWRAEGFCSLRAAKLRAVEAGIERSDLKAIVDEDYSQASYAAKAAKLDEFHAFLSRMQLDDVVVTTSQGQLYVGRLTGEVDQRTSTGGLTNLRRTVEWAPEGYDYGEVAAEIKARLKIQYDVVEMTQQLDLLEKMLDQAESVDVETEEPPAPVTREPLVLPDATDELAEQLHVDRAWLQECIELLRDRPQMIFYGPPGTGKTFIGQALARHLAGDNTRLVQFHPAYSYEDFFEGYRPVSSGGFELKPGPLRKAVEAARENPSVPYVLVIDEINRGNLAKIFGELYFLLEYRDENVDLLYAQDDASGFTLPENLFVIGTMNTADRSIALVDAAMRRRFAFVALHPSEAPTRDVLRRWLQASGRDVSVADLLDELNALIEDPDFKVGPSYFMRSAVHQAGGLERTWRTAILPLLEEHHFGDGTDVAARYRLDDLRRRAAARTADAAVDPRADHAAGVDGSEASTGDEPTDPA
ncbi:AAA family ATPase [Aestuariimicrobium soli]|uniref:AAA family ATPase n=1 Tax=Aestuariimicrobium soli TaxID=2035834 RepID=UPI003EB88743